MSFEPFSKTHIESMIDKELQKLDVEYTPEDSYWILENEEKNRQIIIKSWIKAMWFEEIVENGFVDGRVLIMTYDTDQVKG